MLSYLGKMDLTGPAGPGGETEEHALVGRDEDDDQHDRSDFLEDPPPSSLLGHGPATKEPRPGASC